MSPIISHGEKTKKTRENNQTHPMKMKIQKKKQRPRKRKNIAPINHSISLTRILGIVLCPAASCCWGRRCFCIDAEGAESRSAPVPAASAVLAAFAAMQIYSPSPPWAPTVTQTYFPTPLDGRSCGPSQKISVGWVLDPVVWVGADVLGLPPSRP